MRSCVRNPQRRKPGPLVAFNKWTIALPSRSLARLRNDSSPLVSVCPAVCESDILQRRAPKAAQARWHLNRGGGEISSYLARRRRRGCPLCLGRLTSPFASVKHSNTEASESHSHSWPRCSVNLLAAGARRGRNDNYETLVDFGRRSRPSAASAKIS